MQTEINFGPPHPNPHSTSRTGTFSDESIEHLLDRDWEKTSLGARDQWPQLLRFLFQVCRDSQVAKCIFWGDEHHALYNGGWNHYFGATFEMGDPAGEFFDKEWKESIQPALDQVLSSGDGVKVNNFYWSTGTHEECCYDLALNPIRLKEGEEVCGVLAIAIDVTERIKAKKIKNKIEDALKIETVAIDFFSLNGRVLEANDGFLRMTGYSREELEAGKIRWDEMTPPEYMDLTENAARELKEKGHTDPYEKEYYRKDGSRWWGLFSSQMLEDGTAVEFIVDITERKRNELKYRTLFNSIDEAFCIAQVEFDEQDNPVDYRYLEVNPAFRELTGLEGIEGKSTRKLLPDHEEYWYERYGKVALSRDPIRFEDYSRELGRVYDVFAFPFGNPEDKKIAVLFNDVTERIEAEEKLKSINENLEERVQERTQSLLSYQEQLRTLASKLSKAEELERQRLAGELHDNLGQMLAVSKMKVDLLQKDELPEQTISDVEELRELVDDALTYTRELMSDLKPPPSLDKEGLKANIQWLAKKMEKHDLKVTIENDGQPKPVDSEIRTVLVQCVRELLFNIIKHAGVDEALIKLERVEDEVHIVVEDEGKGFDPESDLSTSLDGGFGLFNISERVDLLGGSVDIESEPGSGTRATISAPLMEEAQQEQESEEEVTEAPPKTEDRPEIVNVLLVDDHEMMREGLRKIVNEQDDLQVIAEASDGREALKKVEDTAPHIVVMDVNMPVMDGIDATQKLLEKRPDVRVIALSLHDHQNVIDSMRSAGATAYLTKNEAFETLCATIRSEAKMIKG